MRRTRGNHTRVILCLHLYEDCLKIKKTVVEKIKIVKRMVLLIFFT